MNKTIYPPLTAQQTTALLILLGSFTDPVSISTAKTLSDTLQQYYDKKEKADAIKQSRQHSQQEYSRTIADEVNHD